jgi:TPP-dependent pyruvate/acetoin dehydrogenase alpha subunit
MESEIAAEIAEAFDHALSSPHPTEDDLHRYVYA